MFHFFQYGNIMVLVSRSCVFHAGSTQDHLSTSLNGKSICVVLTSVACTFNTIRMSVNSLCSLFVFEGWAISGGVPSSFLEVLEVVEDGCWCAPLRESILVVFKCCSIPFRSSL